MAEKPQIIKVLKPVEQFIPIQRITQSLYRVSFDKVDMLDASGNQTGLAYWYMYNTYNPASYLVKELAEEKITEDVSEKINHGFVIDEDASTRIIISTDDNSRGNYLSAYLKAFVDNDPGTISIVIGIDETGRAVTKEFADKEEFRSFYRNVDSHYTALVNEKTSRIDSIREMINNGEYEYVAPVGVSLSESSLTLAQGESAVVSASVSPAEASQTVVWGISDNNVIDASVNADGTCTVTGIADGSCTLRAHAEGVPEIFAECAITVGSEPPSERRIVLDKYEINMVVGDEVDLYSTVLPEGSDQGTHAEQDSPIVNIEVPEVGRFHIIATQEGKCNITVTSKRYEELKPVICIVNISSAKK